MSEQWPVSAEKHHDARDDTSTEILPEEMAPFLERLDRERIVQPAPSTDPALTEGGQCPRC